VSPAMVRGRFWYSKHRDCSAGLRWKSAVSKRNIPVGVISYRHGLKILNASVDDYRGWRGNPP
jgi:hypothetical protein